MRYVNTLNVVNRNQSPSSIGANLILGIVTSVGGGVRQTKEINQSKTISGLWEDSRGQLDQRNCLLLGR